MTVRVRNTQPEQYGSKLSAYMPKIYLVDLTQHIQVTFRARG